MYSGIFVILAAVTLVSCADENGELNLDHHYYEGDILLTKKQQDLLQQSSDGLYSRALTSEVERLWPDGIIPFKVNPGLRPMSKRFIRSAIHEWNTRTCVRLVPKTSKHKNYIEFVYQGGCSSHLGMVGGRQPISVGGEDVTCRHGNIVHEIAHCAGFFHEHSRPDRDNYIRVKWDNIKTGFKLNFMKMPSELIDSYGVGYDYDSITHYGTEFFSKDGTPTIITTRVVPSGVTVGQRTKLSDTDVRQANLLYGCTVQRDKTETSQASDNKVGKNITKANKQPPARSSKKTVKDTKTGHKAENAAKLKTT